jgi:hypothetical protein
MEDKYELKCHSTDDNLEDKSNQLLLPEKKNIAKSKIKYTFKDFTESNIFQIILIIFLVFMIYYGMNYILSNIGESSTTIMKGGRRKC